jgi:hypothetical protein
MSFEVQQVIEFVNYSQFSEQEVSNVDVFMNAMYDAVHDWMIPGYDSIYVTSVVEYYNNSNMANRDSLLLQILKALSVRNAILVIYNIEYHSECQLTGVQLYNDLVASISTA